MAFPLVGVFALGIVGAVGAKVGTDHVYPWMVKRIDSVKNRVLEVFAEIKADCENRAKEEADPVTSSK